MAQKKKSGNTLLNYVNKFAIHLLSEASQGTVGPAWAKPKSESGERNPIPFSERRAFLDSMSKVLLLNNKIDPKTEKSYLEQMQEDLNADDGESDEIERGGSSGSDSSTASGSFSDPSVHAPAVPAPPPRSPFSDGDEDDE